MMNITQDFAPPFNLVAAFFIIGLIFFLASTIFLFNINVNELSIYNSNILTWVHLFLLGFVMMVIFGAMAQLIPVTLEVGHAYVEFYYIIYPLLFIGTILMALGFIVNTSFLPYGGITVFIAMGIFLIETFLTIKKVTNYTLVVKIIFISKIFLFIGLLIGLIMALTYAGQIQSNTQELVKAHVYSLIFGYILLVIMALSLVLLPMFGLSHNFTNKPVKLAVILMCISVVLVIVSSLFSLSLIDIFAYILSICSLLIYFYQIYLIYKTRARKENDIYVKTLFFSFIFFIFSIILAILWLFSKDTNYLITSAYLMFMGFFSLLIIAHLYKIVPFLVWFERFSPLVGKEKVPMLVDMVPVKASYYQLYFAVIGIGLSAYALLITSSDMFYAGLSFLTISAIFLIKNILYIIRFQ